MPIDKAMMIKGFVKLLRVLNLPPFHLPKQISPLFCGEAYGQYGMALPKDAWLFSILLCLQEAGKIGALIAINRS